MLVWTWEEDGVVGRVKQAASKSSGIRNITKLTNPNHDALFPKTKDQTTTPQVHGTTQESQLLMWGTAMDTIWTEQTDVLREEWTEIVDYDTTPTTLTHVTPGTHMMAGWVNDSHANTLEVLTTLIEVKCLRFPTSCWELKKQKFKMFSCLWLKLLDEYGPTQFCSSLTFKYLKCSCCIITRFG